MLVLTRRPGQSIIIQPDPDDLTTRIEVFLSETRGDQARIGIVAPKEVVVLRSELIHTDPNPDQFGTAPRKVTV